MKTTFYHTIAVFSNFPSVRYSPPVEQRVKIFGNFNSMKFMLK